MQFIGSKLYNNRFNLTCPFSSFVQVSSIIHAQTALIRYAERAAHVKRMLGRRASHAGEFMDHHSSLFSPFALSIFAKASYLKKNSTSIFEKARILESISDDIKKCTTFTNPKVSKAALAKSEILNIN